MASTHLPKVDSRNIFSAIITTFAKEKFGVWLMSTIVRQQGYEPLIPIA